MIPLFHSRQKKKYLLPPLHRKHKTTQMGGCVLVEMSGKKLKSLKVYLQRFWDYYQCSPKLQITLSANSS
jgi:hypothetical protein